MAQVLELAQLAQHDRVAQVDVGSGGVDPQLDPQRPSFGPRLHELAQEHLSRQHVHAAKQQLLVILEYLRGTRRVPGAVPDSFALSIKHLPAGSIPWVRCNLRGTGPSAPPL